MSDNVSAELEITSQQPPDLILAIAPPTLPYMADRGRHELATSNRAVVIAQMDGHRIPDRYATGDDDCKFGDAHAKLIHDPYERYGSDTPVDTEPW